MLIVSSAVIVPILDDADLIFFIDQLERRLDSGVILITMRRDSSTVNYRQFIAHLQNMANIPIVTRDILSLTGLEKAYILGSK